MFLKVQTNLDRGSHVPRFPLAKVQKTPSAQLDEPESIMESELQSEWDDFWHNLGLQVDPFFLQNPDIPTQQAGTSGTAGEQNQGHWTSNEDLKSLLLEVCSRLDAIETAVYETKTTVDNLRKSMSAFSKCLYKLLAGGSTDEAEDSAVAGFT